jgi:hypothetical protein
MPSRPLLDPPQTTRVAGVPMDGIDNLGPVREHRYVMVTDGHQKRDPKIGEPGASGPSAGLPEIAESRGRGQHRICSAVLS